MEIIEKIFLALGELISVVWLLRLTALGLSPSVSTQSVLTANWQTISLTFLAAVFLTFSGSGVIPRAFFIIPVAGSAIALIAQKRTLISPGIGTKHWFWKALTLLLGLINLVLVFYIWTNKG